MRGLPCPEMTCKQEQSELQRLRTWGNSQPRARPSQRSPWLREMKAPSGSYGTKSGGLVQLRLLMLLLRPLLQVETLRP